MSLKINEKTLSIHRSFRLGAQLTQEILVCWQVLVRKVLFNLFANLLKRRLVRNLVRLQLRRGVAGSGWLGWVVGNVVKSGILNFEVSILCHTGFLYKDTKIGSSNQIRIKRNKWISQVIFVFGLTCVTRTIIIITFQKSTFNVPNALIGKGAGFVILSFTCCAVLNNQNPLP